MRRKNLPIILTKYYDSLFATFGPQGWWPGRTRFEIIIGAILTQNTAWTNVEKAITNLRAKKALNPERMRALAHDELAGLIRPAGYFNIKAERLRHFLDHLFANHKGSLEKLFKQETTRLRAELLSINGIGPETAESIVDFFKERHNLKVMEKLKKAGVAPRERTGGRFAGKTFLFTGTLFSFTREEAKRLVEEEGGIAASSLSKNVTYVVTGEEPGSKYGKAKELGLKIIAEEEFRKMVKA